MSLLHERDTNVHAGAPAADDLCVSAQSPLNGAADATERGAGYKEGSCAVGCTPRAHKRPRSDTGPVGIEVTINAIHSSESGAAARERPSAETPDAYTAAAQAEIESELGAAAGMLASCVPSDEAGGAQCVSDAEPSGQCSDERHCQTEAAGESLHCHPDSLPRMCTILVPTMFTTAAGRPICVREMRPISADSPYWHLLRFSPAREAVREDADEEQTAGIDSEEHSVEGGHACAWQVTGGGDAATVVSGGDGVFLAAQRTHFPPSAASRFVGDLPRAASCPERCYSGSQLAAAEEGEYSLPAFTGFCTANGRPLYSQSAAFH